MSFELGFTKKDNNGKNSITTVRTLSASELSKFRKANSDLLGFLENERLYKLTILNYQDFLETIIGYSDKYKKEPEKITLESMNEILLNINRCFLNYLFSVRAFLDHTETKISRLYGKQSKSYLLFKDACSEEYDKNFSYRFLYKLRNYSQHCGIPIEGIYLVSEEKPVDSGIVENRLMVRFRKNTLLNYDSWGSLKQEIDSLEDEIEVVSIVANFSRSLDRINTVLLDDYKPVFMKSAEYIQELIKEVSSTDRTPVIYRIEKKDENKQNFIFFNIPFNLLEHAKRLKQLGDGKNLTPPT